MRLTRSIRCQPGTEKAGLHLRLYGAPSPKRGFGLEGIGRFTMLKFCSTKFWRIAAALVLVEAFWLFGHSPRKKGEWFRDLNESFRVMARSNGMVQVGEYAWRLPDNPKLATKYQHPQVGEVTPGDGTQAEPSSKEVVEEDYASGKISILTNATVVSGNSNVLMAIWRSANATAEERASAITKLLPEGTSITSAESLLGKAAQLSHYFGPLLSLTGQGGYIDEGVLEYDTPRGCVAVVFSKKPGSSNELWFDRAFPGSY